jgi:hypothetical protein
MPITISYDFHGASPNDRNYVRSALERFGWRRLGGSVFRYPAENGASEDWLNEVAPALTFLRSYVVRKNMNLTRFTIDSMSVAHVDLSDPGATVGNGPLPTIHLAGAAPSNPQSSLQTIQDSVDAAIDAIP